MREWQKSMQAWQELMTSELSPADNAAEIKMLRMELDRRTADPFYRAEFNAFLAANPQLNRPVDLSSRRMPVFVPSLNSANTGERTDADD